MSGLKETLIRRRAALESQWGLDQEIVLVPSGLPGLYFIDAILTDARWRETFPEEIDWARADRLLGFGGIRIEDNVLVTDEGCEVLTAGVPRSVEEIEEIRREARS